MNFSRCHFTSKSFQSKLPFLNPEIRNRVINLDSCSPSLFLSIQPPAYTPQSPAPPQYQQQQQPPPQQYQAANTGRYGQTMQQQQQQGQQQPLYNYRQPSPSSGMVTLRQTTPISQKPAPVYQSQPPVSSFNGTTTY